MKNTLLAGMLALSLSGCGGGDGESEAEREAEAATGRGTVTCEGSATSEATGLPAGFPELEGITWVSAEDKGPTRVVDGYADRGLEELYDDYRSGFEDAGWSVTFDEIEEDDAEVAYKTADESSDGIVALRSCDDDRTSVHITNRPE
ncbi:MAG: hypothetical protein ACM33B_07600 [Pseudomonadota bacterium]